MMRPIKSIVTVCIMVVVLVVCVYVVWERVELPVISYNNMTFAKAETLTYRQFESSMGEKFQPINERINGYQVYVPVLTMPNDIHVNTPSYIVTEIVLKERNDKFVVYVLKQ